MLVARMAPHARQIGEIDDVPAVGRGMREPVDAAVVGHLLEIAAVGADALSSVTDGVSNVAIGKEAGSAPAGLVANATVHASCNTFVGTQSGAADTSDPSNTVAVGYRALVKGAYALALGSGAQAKASGAVAIGTDNTAAAAQTTTANEIALGTALHRVKVAGRLNVAQRTPTSSADASGAVGDIVADDDYVYAKTSTGWKRAARGPR